MRISRWAFLAVCALFLAGCCPGSMLGGGVAQPERMASQVDSDGDGVPDVDDRCPDTPRGCAVDKYGCALDQDDDGVCDTFDKCPNTPRGERVNADGCSESQLAAMRRSEEPAPVPAPAPSRAERELRERGEIRLENVYFESNSARLTSESAGALDEAGAALARYPELRIEVEGHTDARGAAAYNMRLSQRRAESVRTYLIDHFKLDPAHVTAKGYGEEHASAGRTPEDLQHDRRVVLRVLNPGALPKNVEIQR